MKEIACYLSLETLGIDNSVPTLLIRVPHIVGSRTTLVGNDMSLSALYESTIYWWIHHVSVREDYLFLLSYRQYGDRSWVFQRKGVSPKTSHEWDNVTPFPDMISLVIGFIYIALKADRYNSHTWDWTSLKQIGFLGPLGEAHFEFSKFERTYI